MNPEQKKQLANAQRKATLTNNAFAKSGNNPALRNAAVAAYKEYQQICTAFLAEVAA